MQPPPAITLPPAPDPVAAAAAAAVERTCAPLLPASARQALARLADDNLSLRAAWARLREARAQAARAASARRPMAQLGVDASRARAEPQPGAPLPPGTGGAITFTQVEASLGARFELDLWDRLGRTGEAAAREADARRHDARALAVTLGAEWLQRWHDLAFLRQQAALLDGQAEATRRLLELLKQRFVQGAGPVIDALQQHQQLQAIDNARADAQAQAALRRQQLALLLGDAPGAAVPGADEGDAPPPTLDAPPLLPAGAISRRPDLHAAFERMHAADARLAAALAERLPTLSLSTTLFGSGADIAGVVDRLLWRAAASLAMPLVDGGRLQAGVDEAAARRDAALAAYREALLTALHEVADAALLEREQAAAIDRLATQQRTAADVRRLAREQYLRGAVGFVRVLEAERAALDAERALLQAERQRLARRLQLCRALGVDWAAVAS